MSDPHSVDEILPAPRLAALGIQHVLVMYAGAVAVPLIISGALGLPPEQRTLLINADLFACGLATLVQAFGIGGVGIRLPVMMGVTFASVAPMLAMVGAGKAAGMTPNAILLQIYGSVIAAGIFGVIVSPLISRCIIRSSRRGRCSLSSLARSGRTSRSPASAASRVSAAPS